MMKNKHIDVESSITPVLLTTHKEQDQRLHLQESTQTGYLTLTEEQLSRLVTREKIENSYLVENKPFARGKYATVRSCRDRKTGEQYAAKFLRKRRRCANVCAEILHEIAVLDACKESPEIVKLHRVFESNSEMILLLELAKGGELQMLLDKDEIPSEEQVACIMHHLLDGLIFLHSIDVAHLDIKPQNIVLTDEFPKGHVKLCDFGISRYIQKDADIKEILGTPDYVAPEILNYESITLATDMWSVGVLMYVLLTGCSPFGGDTKQETFCNITKCKLDFPDELFQDISSNAKDIMRKLITKDPRDRLSAVECLRHPWFQSFKEGASSSSVPYIHQSVDKINRDYFCFTKNIKNSILSDREIQLPEHSSFSHTLDTVRVSPDVSYDSENGGVLKTDLNDSALSPKSLVKNHKENIVFTSTDKVDNTNFISPLTIESINKICKFNNLVMYCKQTSSNIQVTSKENSQLNVGSVYNSSNNCKNSENNEYHTRVNHDIHADRENPGTLISKKDKYLNFGEKVDETHCNIISNTNNDNVTLAAIVNKIERSNGDEGSIDEKIRERKSSSTHMRYGSINGINVNDNNHNRYANIYNGNQQIRTVIRRDEIMMKKLNSMVDRLTTNDDNNNNSTSTAPSLSVTENIVRQKELTMEPLFKYKHVYLLDASPDSSASENSSSSVDSISDTLSEFSIDSCSDRSSITSLDDTLDIMYNKATIRAINSDNNWNNDISYRSKDFIRECRGSFARALSNFTSNAMNYSEESYTNTEKKNISKINNKKCIGLELVRENGENGNGNLIVIRELKAANGSKHITCTQVKCESLQSRIKKLQVQNNIPNNFIQDKCKRIIKM